MGISLLKRPVYYQQVYVEPHCSCDEYCDVNELELMRLINNFTCTYYNLKKDNTDLIRISKTKVKEILEYYNENIINNKPAPVCCGDYCNTEELTFFKFVNNHYNKYFNISKEERKTILEGAKKLTDIYNLLKEKFNINPCNITSINVIKHFIRNENLNDGTYNDKFDLDMAISVVALGFYFKDNNKQNITNDTHYNDNITGPNLDC